MRVAPLLDRIGRFCDLIDRDDDSVPFAALRAAETTGRALGSSATKAEAQLDQLQMRMPGMTRET